VRAGSAGVAAVAALCLASCDAEGGADPEAFGAAAPVPVVAGAAGLEAYLDCLSDEGVTLLDAHRGGPRAGYPENAIATFARTLSDAPVLIEADVGVTRDGVLVLLHDDALDRTTTCEGALEETSYSDLGRCRLVDNGGGRTDFPVPTLEEALVWSEGRTVLKLDPKPAVRYEDLIAAVRRADAEERVMVIAYSAAGAARLHRVGPDLVITAPMQTPADLDDLEDRGVDLDQVVAWLGTDNVQSALVLELEARDVPVSFGAFGRSVLEEGNPFALAASGVDLISTDRPTAAYEAIRSRRDPAVALAGCRSGS
jgi:glycerophosphoryl diester phosphodiesterase